AEVLAWRVAPVDAGPVAVAVDDSFDDSPVVLKRSGSLANVRAQQCFDLLPLLIDEDSVSLFCSHVSTVTVLEWSIKETRPNPRLNRPYLVRQMWMPALGGAAGVLLVVVSLVPGTPLSLGSIAEYIIVFAWPVLGFILYGLTKKPKDPEDSLRHLLGDYYDEFRGEPQ